MVDFGGFPRQVWTVFRAMARFAWIFLTLMTFIPIYFCCMFILNIVGLPFLWPRAYWFFEGKVYRWLQNLCGYWGHTAGYEIVEYGDDLSEVQDERCLVIINHQSTADVPTLMGAFTNKGLAARKGLWIMAIEFRWTPFGVVSQVHGDHFIAQGKSVRNRELERLGRHLDKVFYDRDRRWVLLFPEGGFLYKRREQSNRYAEQNGYPQLQHCTLPRTGAVRVILETLGPPPKSASETASEQEESGGKKLVAGSDGEGDVDQMEFSGGMKNSESEGSLSTGSDEGWEEVEEEPVKPPSGPSGDDSPTKKRQRFRSGRKRSIIKATVSAIRSKAYLKQTRPPIKYVVDVTLAYDEGEALGFHTLWLGYREPKPIRIQYRVFKAEDVPYQDEELLRDWMYERYVEKEKLLEEFYQTGVFAQGEEGRPLRMSRFSMFLKHGFFLLAGYLHWKYWMQPVALALLANLRAALQLLPGRQ